MPFLTSKNARTQELERLREEMMALRERAELLDTSCGVGLWQAVLHNQDASIPAAPGPGHRSSAACWATPARPTFPMRTILVGQVAS